MVNLLLKSKVSKLEDVSWWLAVPTVHFTNIELFLNQIFVNKIFKTVNYNQYDGRTIF